MNGVNFFTWLRDGVRQSVLLGVSDAVEQLGTPASTDEIHPSVAGILAPRAATRSSEPLLATPGQPSTGRKRLGRSLKEMNPPPQS
ncbi:MAG: hypothetical protein KF752_17955 [Pirellulaceae bacterium]|nr:hypothetical protein [Pirellulaceae bacterium]